MWFRWSWVRIPSSTLRKGFPTGRPFRFYARIAIFAERISFMENYQKVTYWCEMSDYDLETAYAMFQTGRYLYVGFMCHQTIEKILKALWSYRLTDIPPKTHSLSRLAEQIGLDIEFSEKQLDLIDQLEPLNIEARYPSYKERLMQSLTDHYCQWLLQQTSELQ